jgi:DNA-binding PadR family transcriptional regulator
MDARTLCLGVLMLGDASGYGIKKHFEEGPFAHFHAAGFGSIYPALKALEAERLVTCTEMEQEGRPDKKVYSITEAGRRAFRRALHREPAADSYRSEAVFMLFFAELLDDDHLGRVYRRHLAVQRRTIERIGGCADSGIAPGRRFVRGLGLAVSRAVAEYMENNHHLLFGERTGSPPMAAQQGRPPERKPR